MLSLLVLDLWNTVSKLRMFASCVVLLLEGGMPRHGDQ